MAVRNVARIVCILVLLANIGVSKTKTGSTIEDEGSKGKVLVFGGTGFIGSHIVEQLLDNGYEVTLTHRGSWYWDSAKFKDKVMSITCDRDWPMKTSCPKLMRYIQFNIFESVVDVSGVDYHHVRDAITALRNRTKLYVYISSDSVYEVCNKSHSDPTKESDAVRPTSTAKVAEYANADAYGNKKFVSENDVIKQRLRGGFPFVILRLPDVIGPRDTSPRWLTYQVWQTYAQMMTTFVRIPKDTAHVASSYVFVKDVARVVIKLLQPQPEVYDTVYNVAFRETNLTLELLLREMADALGLIDPIYSFVDAEDTDARALYPSVQKGPLDVSKIKRVLGFEPTPLKEAIQETVAFYIEAIESGKYSDQLLKMEDLFTKFKLLAGPSRYKQLIKELRLEKELL
ncbi:uncharacterized protein LOC135496024 [Lineus longissimus]|uniref:uncharacterized protein LOC135496024 n=1 Tax=Lineus longissimus TaxID=88925 RepID=UPI002B4FB03A